MDEKRCKSCSKLKSISAYGRQWNKRYERFYYTASCKECLTAKRCAERRDPTYKPKRRVRTDFSISRIKEATKVMYDAKSVHCMDCTQTFPPYVMDFDHRPGEVKLFNIGESRGKNLNDIIVEIAKCDVVCSNCHRIRTHERRQMIKGVS